MIHNFIKEDHKQIKEDVQEMKSFVEQFDALKLERDALWVKTQEDERIINDLRDINKQLRDEIESDNAELDTAWSKVVELQNWKEEALKVMNQWNEVSDYINFNAEVEDLGRFVPQICLKYLKERDEMKKLDRIPNILKPMLGKKFPDIVQSEITPVPKEEA